ncbi:hypothetical protein LCGC14_2181490, partial [marine sediment metagenome]
STTVSKTSDTTLNLTTATDWVDDTSDQTTDAYGYIYINAAGKIEMDNIAPDESDTSGNTTGILRYNDTGTDTTDRRCIGWFFMNATGSGELSTYEVGNLKDGDVHNSVVRTDSTQDLVNDTTYGTDLTNTQVHFYTSGRGIVNVKCHINGAHGANTEFVAILNDGSDIVASEAGGEPASLAAINSTTATPVHAESYAQGTFTFEAKARVQASTWTVEEKTMIIQEAYLIFYIFSKEEKAMKRWKRILLGAMIVGFSWAGIASAVTIRNGPAGDSQQELVVKALRDNLNTDGSWTDLGAVTTVDINGGTIDGATIGASSATTGAFTTITGSGISTTTISDAGTATQALAIEIIHETSGTPTTNIGVSMDFTAETSASNNEKLVKISVLAEDTTAGSEDGAFIISVMGAGATATEQFRVGTATISMLDNNVTNVGQIDVDSISADGSSIIVNDAIAFTGVVTTNGALTIESTFDFGTDTLTTDSANPGTATATLAEVVTYVISDNAGADEDVVTLIDGTIEGQIKRFIYLTDNETSGVAIAPSNVTIVGGAGTSTLMEDAGDFVEFTWNTALGWTLSGNIGGTIE